MARRDGTGCFSAPLATAFSGRLTLSNILERYLLAGGLFSVLGMETPMQLFNTPVNVFPGDTVSPSRRLTRRSSRTVWTARCAGGGTGIGGAYESCRINARNPCRARVRERAADADAAR